MNDTNRTLSNPEQQEAFKRKKCETQAAYRKRQKSSEKPTAPETGSSTQGSTWNPQSVPQTGPSTRGPTRYLDLVSGVRGIQVHESADVLAWPGGLRTIVPTLIRDGQNILHFDEKYLRSVATYPEATPSSRYIDFLSKESYQDYYDFVTAIRHSLSVGRPVVVRNFEDTSSFTFTEDGILRTFGISPNMRVDIHDTARRAKVFHEPHVVGTMSQLIAGINNPEECQFVLDIPLTQRGMSGIKLWTLYFVTDPTLSREELKDLIDGLCDPDIHNHPHVCAETVYLYPGDLLIQPPAQVHSVYTPTASFSIGGHFYSYDCCHLTEIGRRFDALLNGRLTNQVHHHAFETIVQMVIGLPRSNPNRSLKTHSIVALCLMVLQPESYKMKEHKTQLSPVVRRAQSIAKEIINTLGYGAVDQYPYFAKRNYLDAGETFPWQLGLEQWQVLP
ncbi:hypothetical protein OG21DRAFT_1525962 [Imleria badia]|nr:hypothetical protein OG21DRAFT_1525962 [Imleria badia]